MAPPLSEELFDRLVPDEVVRRGEQPAPHARRHFLVHVASLGATKTGDGLADPKLVLSWLLGALGAGPLLIGWLVPLREAGALLPQLVAAPRVRRYRRRRDVWSFGSLVQGLCVLGMALVALGMEGTGAGVAILGLLLLFAVARSLCSVSYKDVLGKTLPKRTRGSATGLASSLAATLVLVFGLLLGFDVLPRTVPAIASVLFVAGGLWCLAALLFRSLHERADRAAPESTPRIGLADLGLLRRERLFRRFVMTRALLTGTALAPPFLLALGGPGAMTSSARLGPFLVASALAAMASSWIWGRLADASSRRVLALSGLLAAGALAVALLADRLALGGTAGQLLPPIALFGLMVAHQGVRLGRSTHLVDMARDGERVVWTAVANTVIGVVLLLMGGVAALAALVGPALVLVLFALMTLGGSLCALGLRERQRESPS